MKVSQSEMRQGIPAMGDTMKAADLGEMTGAFVTVPAGSDFRPVLGQLEGGNCPVPHWGYVVTGALNIGYGGDKAELAKAGDLFWMEPGHTVWVDEDTTYVDFSPGREMNELLKKVDKIVAG